MVMTRKLKISGTGECQSRQGTILFFYQGTILDTTYVLQGHKQVN